MNEPAKLLPWDSDFFGCRIATVTAPFLDEESVAATLAWAEQKDVACLYLLTDTADLATIAYAEAAGFELRDVRATFCRRMDDPPRAPLLPAEATLRPATTADIPALLELAWRSHTSTRFFSDARLAARAPALYATWLAKDLAGRADVLVLCWQDEPIGYVTCQLTGQLGQIGLIALDERLRGRGLGLALVQGALAWFAARDAHEVKVITQGRNLGVRRLYERAGFRTAAMQLWYHRWFTSCAQLYATPEKVLDEAA